jgi:hypothetical protein
MTQEWIGAEKCSAELVQHIQIAVSLGNRRFIRHPRDGGDDETE